MNPDVFFENFEMLAEAPNGVQKLRELILQLAIRGRLVPQSSEDEPAPMLLKRIESEKNRLIREKKARKSNTLSPIDLNDLPFQIPDTWKWVYLSDVGQIVGGGTPKTGNPDYFSEKEVSWLTPADLYNLNGKYIGKGRRDISELGLQKSSAQLMPAGTVLFSSRAPIGYVAIASNELSTNQGFKSCVPFIMEMNEFIYYFLKIAGKEIDKNASGTTFKEVSGKIMSQVLFSLPPLAEQKRIVSKVDELMALCDQLEARQQKKQELRSKLNSAALEKMLSAESQDEFEENWRRICENFDLLYDNPENVEELRKAVLQLAVQGKLVEQDPDDELASVLIEKIETEKRKLIKEGKIKKTKKLQPICTEETPYSLPNGWLWTRFGNIAPYIEAGWSPMCEKRPKEGDEWGVLKISAVSWDIFNPSENKALPSNLKPRPEYEVKTNDFLMSRANTSELVGKSVVVEDTPSKLMINDKVLRLFFCSFAYKKFYNTFNNSQTARFYYAKEASGTSSSMKNISREVIYNMPVPLPPLNEQKRIVEKVEQLMGLCDELERKLRKGREESERMMEAVVRGLLESSATEI